jgi:uncharacterized membrane-anchored protein
MSQLLGTSLPKTHDRNAVADLAVKVPEVTVAFWIIKILSTAMGEALSDFLDGGRGVVFPALGVLVALVAFIIALRRQFRAPRYQTGTYWFAVAMVATFGTMAADAFHQALGFPYWMTSLLYVVILAGVFIRWYSTEGTLSIHSINTRRRERYYWATVLATFALGTATGDMTATDFHWGFLASGIVFAVVILLPALGYWKLRLNPVFAFWFAYVITRPLGASFADWLDVSTRRGGVGIGTAPVSLVLVVVIVGAVAWLARSHSDERRPGVTFEPAHHPARLHGLVVDPES